jgi:hypothetical protein
MPRRAQVLLTNSKGDSLVKNASINVGIVGATGAVGQELLTLLHERNFPMASLRLFASARSAGKVIERGGKKFTVEEAKPGVFAGVDVAFFAAGGSVTRALAPDAVKSGLSRDRQELGTTAWTRMFRWSFRRSIPRDCGTTRASSPIRIVRRP